MKVQKLCWTESIDPKIYDKMSKPVSSPSSPSVGEANYMSKGLSVTLPNFKITHHRANLRKELDKVE